MKPAAWMLATLLLALPGLAETALAETDGATLYQRHCAACHGADADGNGPMAAVLTLQPTDLTSLSAGNGGTFPIARVVARIDGREPLVSHGSPMPLFGHLYERQNSDLTDEAGTTLRTSAEIVALLAHLQAIQR